MRKILFALGNRAHYARIKPIIEKLNNKCDYKLLLYDTAYSSLKQILKKDNNLINCFFVKSHIYGSTLLSMTKSTGNAILKISDVIDNYSPDIIVVIADRYEIMAPAIIARYMNICLVHIQGGEITGTVDDSIRHSVSKLANYHFVSNIGAKKNLLKMGEFQKNIIITGCPTLDIINCNKKIIDESAKQFWKVSNINEIPNYILVNFHPVTTEYIQNSNYISILYDALKNYDGKIIWLLPNADAGSNKIREKINTIKKEKKNILFFENFEIIQYISLMKYAKCIVGNSSVGIRESSFLGVPSITIGTRQNCREVGANVVKSNIESSQIKKMLKLQLTHGKYNKSTLYGKGNASEVIANKLLSLKIEKEKFYKGDNSNDK